MTATRTIDGLDNFTEFRRQARKIARELVEGARCTTRDGSPGRLARGDGRIYVEWAETRTGRAFNRQPAEFRRQFLQWFVDFIAVESEAAGIRCHRNLENLPFAPPTEWIGIWDGDLCGPPEYDLYPTIFSKLLRKDLHLSAADICDLFERILSQGFRNRCPATWRMLALARLLPDRIGSAEGKRLERIAHTLREATRGERKVAQLQRVIAHIQSCIDDGTDGRVAAAIVANLKGDDFGNRVAARLCEATPAERSQRAELLRVAAEASNAKPSAAFSKTAKAALGASACTNAYLIETLEAALAARVRMTIHHGEKVPHYLYTEHNIRVLKGLVWMSLDRLDDELIDRLSRLQRKSYARLAGIGSGAEAVGNAVTWLWKQIGHE